MSKFWYKGRKNQCERDVFFIGIICTPYVMPTNFFVSLLEKEDGWGGKCLASSVAVLLYCQACQGLRRGFLEMEGHRLNSPTIHWHLLIRLRHQGWGHPVGGKREKVRQGGERERERGAI